MTEPAVLVYLPGGQLAYVTNVRVVPAPFLPFVHGVLKWLHHPLLKYVMLLHPASSWHDFLHASRFGSFPGEDLRYTSPALVSHTVLTPT